MNFTRYDLGQQSRGATVAVTLDGTEANVFLVDSVNLARYQRGDTYNYYGGHATHSPVRLTVPQDGHWHVVVDLGGFVGAVETAVEVFA